MTMNRHGSAHPLFLLPGILGLIWFAWTTNAFAQRPDSAPIARRFAPSPTGREPEMSLVPPWAPTSVDGKVQFRFSSARLVDGGPFAIYKLVDGSCLRIDGASSAPFSCGDPLLEATPPNEEGGVLFVPLRVVLDADDLSRFFVSVLETLAKRVGKSVRDVRALSPRFDVSIPKSSPIQNPKNDSNALGNRILALSTDANALARELATAGVEERVLISLALTRFRDPQAIPGLIMALPDADYTRGRAIIGAISEFGVTALEHLEAAGVPTHPSTRRSLVTLLDDLRFERAKTIRTEAAFDTYLEAEPKGRHRSEADWAKVGVAAVDPVRNNRLALTKRLSSEPEGRIRWALLEAMEDLLIPEILNGKPGTRFAVRAMVAEKDGLVGNITLDGLEGATMMTTLYPSDKIVFGPLGATGFRAAAFTGIGSRVRFRGGKVRVGDVSIEGDSLEPLSFVLTSGEGLVYVTGRGTVTNKDGAATSLPRPAVSTAKRPQRSR